MLSSCAAHAGLDNFHVVEDGKIYRSAQPDAAGYDRIKAAGIRTVIKLNTENAKEERSLANSMGISLYEMPLSGLFAPDSTAESQVQELLTRQDLYPILIHCEHGSDRTGLAVALYRVYRDGWSPGDAHREWMQFGHSSLLIGMDDFFEDHSK